MSTFIPSVTPAIADGLWLVRQPKPGDFDATHVAHFDAAHVAYLESCVEQSVCVLARILRNQIRKIRGSRTVILC
jgi:hypothetical protein